MTDDDIRALELQYGRTRDWIDRKRLARALKRAGEADKLIALYEPLLTADSRHREEYLDESYLSIKDRQLLSEVLRINDQSGLVSVLHGEALKSSKYDTLNVSATTPPRARLPFDTRIERLTRAMRFSFGEYFRIDRVLQANDLENPGRLYSAIITKTPIHITYHTPGYRELEGLKMRI